ncbi:MAG TPA: BamA/TamA family outer membrane protein, partial [Rhodothermales bacterium]|nr:BamA/TamA family outer membrane protein [Rhodothermales bacterium]
MRHRRPHLRHTALLIGIIVLALAFPATLRAQYFRFGKNKVQYQGHDWHYLQSEHFDVYYYEDGYLLANFTAHAAEAAYAQITRLVGYEITDRIPIIAYQSHNDFSVTNALDLPTYSEGIGGVTELFKNRVAVPFMGDYRDYRRVIHHELVHAVLNDMFFGGSIQSILQNNIQLRIPLWFNEGLAEYAALGWDTQSDMYVREAVLEDHLPPIKFLDGYFAYRGGQSVWDYVAEQYGQEKIAEILQRVRVTRNVESSFQRATGLTLDELSDRWHQTLKEIYYPEVAARQSLDDVAKAVVTRENGYLNTSPALSPKGDKLAYITTKGALFDVYLADPEDGTVIGKLIDGQNNTEFESLRILTPGLSWSPDGKRIAVAVKSGRSDAVAVVDVDTRHTTEYRIPGIDQIITVAWSPQGGRIAFEGSMNGQSDIYVLDLGSREAVNYTDDVFSDHEPAWSPDGSTLVFYSDRGGHLEVGKYRAGTFQMFDDDYSQYDLYLLEPGEGQVRRATSDETWDDRSARFSADGNKLLFISDRNGVYNLYEKNLLTGSVRPVTDDVVGVTQLSLSADGSKAAFVRLREGTSSIYVMKDPFDHTLPESELAPNVWAERVGRQADLEAPALTLASASVLQNNPLLRDASDGIAYARNRAQSPALWASRSELMAQLLNADGAAPAPLDTVSFLGPGAESDTSAYGNVSVDFHGYNFGREAREADREDDDGRFQPVDNVDEHGNYKPKKYKLSFSSDLIYGTAGYDMLYGAQGITQMMFSDMLGDHQIFVATNLLIDLRNSDYIVAYNYLPRRIDWSFSAFHMSRLLQDYRYGAATFYQYRQYGAGVLATYPLDKFQRLDFQLNLLGVSQADITDPASQALVRSLIHPSVTFTRDVSTPGRLYPTGGHRFAVSLSGSPGNLVGEQIRFLTLLGDARFYTSFGRGFYSVALRASAGTSLGPEKQLFYASGVQNWINRAFDETNGFPINDVSDFLFATPVMPLRGYDINKRNGSNFGLVNAEFRFPLVAALLPGPIPVLPLYDVQGVAFLDAGSIWGGRGLDKRFNLFHKDEAGKRYLDDLLIGAGFGLRTILLG